MQETKQKGVIGVRVKARASDPITSLGEVERLREYLRGESRQGERNALLVTVGTNTGLRASDLCKLKVGDLSGEFLDVIEQKTKKRRVIKLNEKLKNELERYVEKYQLSEWRYVFESEKGGYLKPKSLHKIMKEASRALGLRGNIGSHTLRKTMAYHVLHKNMDNENIVNEIMLMFNHTSAATTERYLKSSADSDDMYMSLNI